MELTESVALAEWLKRYDTNDEVHEIVVEACFDYVDVGVLRDDPDDDYCVPVYFHQGMLAALEAKRLSKPVIYARDEDMLYFFIGSEDEVIEKLMEESADHRDVAVKVKE